MTPKALTPKEEKFCQAIVAGKSQTDAYRTAYDALTMKPKTMWKRASEVMKKPHVTARIEALRVPVVEAVQKSRIEWLKRIEQCAFGDLRGLRNADGKLKDWSEVSDDVMPLVAGFEVFEEFDGRGDDRVQIGITTKIKVVDQLAALTLYGKATGYLQEKEKPSSPLEEFGAAALLAVRQELLHRIAEKDKTRHGA